MEIFEVKKCKKYACYDFDRFSHHCEHLIDERRIEGFEGLYNYFKKENGGELSKEFVEGICKHSYTKVYGENNGLNYICYYVSKV